MKNTDTGIKRLVSAFNYSLNGLRTAYASEAAFRQEVWLALVLTPAAWFVGDTSLERGVLIASVLVLLIVELLNTAIEKTVDRIGSEFHELSGAAKDIGSAAVLLALMMVLLIWIAVIFN